MEPRRNHCLVQSICFCEGWAFMHISMLPFMLEGNKTTGMSVIWWNRLNQIMEMELQCITALWGDFWGENCDQWGRMFFNLLGWVNRQKWLIVVSLWAGQQSGHDDYLLWDLIGQLAWVKRQWKTHETRHKARTQTWPLLLYNWNRSTYYTQTHTHTHMLERASQLFLSRCVDLEAVACFSHFWVFVWRAVGWRCRHTVHVFSGSPH